MCTAHRQNTSQTNISNVYCAHTQNIFQAVHQKFVLCTDTEHFPDGTPEMCTVRRNRTLSRRYTRNVYCVQTQNTFQTLHQKCVLCAETEHFPDGTHKAVFADHKTTLNKETRRFTYLHQHMQLTHNKSHT